MGGGQGSNAGLEKPGVTMKYTHVFIALVIFVFFAGCSDKGTGEDKALGELGAYDYTCDDGSKFTVQFNKVQDNMALTMDGATRTLRHLISGSGTRYGDGELTYWGKGDTAMLIRGADITNCKVVEK